ncbi:MAG: hypothetical protein GXN96_02735 [Aquificae bacterium]|nr:hypothetical protein [Aquificota bacterium]
MLLEVLTPNGRRRYLKAEKTPPDPVGYRVLFRDSRGLGTTGIVRSTFGRREEGFVEVFPDNLPLVLPEHIRVAGELARYYVEPLGKVLWDFIPSVFEWYEEEVVKVRVKDPAGLDRKTKEVLEYIKKRGKVPYDTLKRKFPSGLIRVLLERHLILKEREWVSPGEEEEFLELALPLQEALKKIRSEKKRELIRFIAQRGTVSTDELRERGFSSSTIRDLIKRGILREAINPTFPERLSLPERGEVIKARGKRVVVSGSFEYALGRLISLAEERINRGEDLLIICPSREEISLLSEVLGRRFGERLISLNSVKGKKLYSLWFKAHEGNRIGLGSFKGVFLPLPRLKTVVLFNELAGTRYPRNGIDLRRLLYHLAEASGGEFYIFTPYPSLETMLTLEKGIFSLEEETPAALLRVYQRRGEVITQEVVNFLRQLGKESVLFLVTKKGYSYLYCPRCEHLAECPECGTFLTFSREEGVIFCTKRKSHFLREERSCPECGGYLEELGFGIEKAKEVVLSLFGERENFKFSTKLSWHERHDYVIILNADGVLSVPGYRSKEEFLRTVALALRVARKGVILQSSALGKEESELLTKGELWELFRRELARRKEERLPPFYRLAVVESRERLADYLRSEVTEDFTEVTTWEGYRYLVRFRGSEVLRKLRNLKNVRISLE